LQQYVHHSTIETVRGGNFLSKWLLIAMTPLVTTAGRGLDTVSNHESKQRTRGCLREIGRQRGEINALTHGDQNIDFTDVSLQPGRKAVFVSKP
jgi:hypothetical protein